MEVNKELEKVHLLELKIAIELKRICELHSIPYFMTAGTLLGAIRHGGFIPWDDDMDFGMLREDFNSFIEACNNELGEEYVLQTWNTDPGYPFSYAKLRLKNTHFVEGFADSGDRANDGIFIDIFPFDNVPNDAPKQKIQGCKYFICKRLLWIKKGYGRNMLHQSVKQSVKYYSFKFLSLLLRYSAIKRYFSRTQIKYNEKLTDYVVTDGSYAYQKECIKREWAENLIPIRFETEEFLSYRDYKDYLTHFYGDYMKLPPVEKRDRHELLKVDFGPYDNN